VTSSWQLEDFELRIDEWIEREDPPIEWRLAAFAWTHGLHSDPYQRSARQTELGPDVWFAKVPGIPSDVRDLTCTYTIDPADLRVRCWYFASLRRPT
jgi:hypothetical protein